MLHHFEKCVGMQYNLFGEGTIGKTAFQLLRSSFNLLILRRKIRWDNCAAFYLSQSSRVKRNMGMIFDKHFHQLKREDYFLWKNKIKRKFYLIFIYPRVRSSYPIGTRANLAYASGNVPYPVSSLAHKSSAMKTETINSLRSASYETCICIRPVTCFSFAICS